MAVMGQQNGLLVTQRARDDLTLLVSHRNSGPLGQEGTVVVERRDVHLRDDKRHLQHRQGSDVKGVGVHDAAHIRTSPIDPRMEPVGRVCHSFALQNGEVLVDQQQVAGGDFVEAQSQSLGVVGARRFGTGGDLPRQTGVVPGVEQRTASQRHFLADRQRGLRDVAVHAVQRSLHQVGLGCAHGCGHEAPFRWMK